MSRRMTATLLCSALAASPLPALAHHSFAIYDMQQNVEFHGVIESVKFVLVRVHPRGGPVLLPDEAATAAAIAALRSTVPLLHTATLRP